MTVVTSVFSQNPISNVIALEECDEVYKCIKYTFVPWKPLVENELCLCLGDFVSKVKDSISKLHTKGFAHLDLRLDNICFDANFYPVLIDLDRARRFIVFGASDVYPHSCMYCITLDAVQHDWRQLGIIILWVLTRDQQPSYHQQTLLVDHSIVSHPFLTSLINKGKISCSRVILR